MRTRRAAGGSRGWTARGAGVAALTAASLLLAPGVAEARPHNPTNGEISAAEKTADDAAAQVGAVSAQLASAESAASRAMGEANIALDHFQEKQAEFEAAHTAARAADAAAHQAQADLAAARTAVAAFARDSYMAGTTSSGMMSLITSGSPAQMLERSALLGAAGDHRSDVLVQVAAAEQQATVTAQTAHTTLARADQLKKEAAGALAAAEQQEASARAQASAFQAQKAQLEGQLAQARQTLISLKGERAAAIAFDQQAARSASSSSSSGSSSSGSPASSASGSSSSSASGSSGSSGSAASSGSGTTAGPGSSSAAQTAIRAARRYIGISYAWGGGSTTGPTEGWGIDDNVIGFDCSGLTRYAYAQAGITIPRNSRAQYAGLPKVARADLRPGDLVFWAFDTGDPDTIHHVALYVGGDRIIEAPESGALVRETGMRWGGYIGAVRPSA